VPGRILRIALLVGLVVVVVAVATFGWVTYRALPQAGGSLTVAGLHAPVTVVRDANGIAQITAQDPHDLFMAQGYVHAQDRLWQMEVWRHIGAGRLSELFGASQVETDTYIRTLGWRQSAEADLAALSPQAVAVLQAYADGVNAYIDGHKGSLGLAFVVTGLQAGLPGGVGGYTPEPWTPLDSIAWQKVQAFNLGGNYDTEIFRMLADSRLGDRAMTDELFPAYDPGMPVITPTALLGAAAPRGTVAPATDGPLATTAADGASWSGTATPLPWGNPSGAASAASAAWHDVAELRSHVLALAGLDQADGIASDHGIGSNDWVVSGSLSATGGALLANDPHLGFSMPSVWYMNGLHCATVDSACPYDVVGVSFPGVPAVVLGHNANIAWGATNVGPDVQDLFVEQVVPDDWTKYRFRGQTRSFDVRTETIRIAGKPSIQIQVRSTVHGPVVNDIDSRLAGEPILTLRAATLIEPDRTFEAFLGLDTAANFDDFRNALRVYGSPSQNFVYADTKGHIGYQLPGRIPVRAGILAGDRPRNGASGNEEWTGFVPFDRLPWQYDPPSGVIATANNAAVDSRYAYFLGDDWDPGWRARRILDLITKAEPGGVTTDELQAIQMDTYVLRADVIAPLLVTAKPTTDDGRLLLDRIRNWDHECGTESLGCAAYMSVELSVLRAIFDDQLGDALARDYVGSSTSWQALIALLKAPTNAWWDDVTTPATEQAPEVLARGFDAAGRAMRDAVGGSDGWTWGRVHTVAFRESTLGESGIGLLEWYFNSGGRPVNGAAGAVDNTYYRPSRLYPDPAVPGSSGAGFDTVFQVTNGPSYRLVVDMTALDAATIVTTTGQAGNPFDSHYGDLIDDWASGARIPLPFSASAVQDAGKATLTLQP
jgi:penicillin amidase